MLEWKERLIVEMKFEGDQDYEDDSVVEITSFTISTTISRRWWNRSYQATIYSYHRSEIATLIGAWYLSSRVESARREKL